MQFGSDSAEEECTCVIVTGTASEGGYAILSKNRDSSSADAQKPVYTPASTGVYACVMENSYWMGMNEKGLAITNTVVSALAFGGSGLDNGALNKWIVQHCATLDEVCYELNNTAGAIGPKKRQGGTCIGVVDRFGKGAFIEVSGTGAYARFVVDGFDSEANHPRNYPRYASGPSGRDQYALDEMQRICENEGKISYEDVVQKVVRYVHDKEQGSLSFTVSGEVSNDNTQSSFVAVSGDTRYDGRLNCFWGEYGNNPIVGLFVPTIVFAGTPPSQTQSLYSLVLQKRSYARNGATSYLPDRVREIQSCAFAAEDDTFADYASLVSTIPEGLNDSELSSMLASYVTDSVSHAVAAYSQVASDDFESGDFSMWSGTATTNAESATVTESLSHHGSFSATFSSGGSTGTSYAYCYKSVVSSSEIYARGYFYVSKSGIIDNSDRFYLIAFNAGSSSVACAGWRKVSGVVCWCLMIKSYTTSVYAYSAASPSLNEWHCVELHWKKNSQSGLGELWVDGMRVCRITGRNTSTYGNVNQICFGLPNLYSCAATTIYTDCVRAATSYVGQET